MWEYRARLYKVIDADTMDLNLDLGFKIEHIVRIRLTNPPINAPEKNTLEGKEAILAIQRLIINDVKSLYDWNLTVQTEFDKTFDRFLGSVFLSDGTNVGQWLLDNGHAVPWIKK